MIKFDPHVTHARLKWLGAGLCGAFGLIALRYAYLGAFPSDLRSRLLTQDNRQHLSTTELAMPRAPIVDRNGRPLALTVMKPSVFVIPTRIPDGPEGRDIRRRLAQLSGVKAARLLELKESGRQFFWLQRQTSDQVAKDFTSIPGWEDFGGILKEPARFYPYNSLASQLIGFTGIDNQGLAGIELIFENRLRSEKQTVQVTRDAKRRLSVTFPNEASKPAEDPVPLRLTLDIEVQRILENELESARIHAKAEAASGVILDISTGDVFGMASLPGFNLNVPNEKTTESARLRPIQDALELGSVVKPLVIAAALDSKKIRPGERLNCEGGSLRLPGATIHDVKKKDSLSIAEVLLYSSNICTYKIAKRLGKSALIDYYERFGLTSPPQTGLAGEFPGTTVKNPESMREIRFANVAFGQGIAVSPLQMARALSTLIGDGIRRPVRIVSESQNTEKEQRVVSPETSAIVRTMMKAIVSGEDATAIGAQMDEFTAGGKTGTAQRYNPVTRSYSDRTASFIGYFPAEHPKFVIYIVIDKVGVRPAWGGTLAAPSFAAVGSQLGRYLKATGQLALTAKEDSP